MCKDCDLSHTREFWKEGCEPPVPKPPVPTTREEVEHSKRFAQWDSWWARVLDQPVPELPDEVPAKCVVCRSMRKGASPNNPETGCPCCGNCGMLLTRKDKDNSSSKLEQRHDICTHFQQFEKPVSFCCDECWSLLFPCRLETHRVRRQALEEELRQEHDLELSEINDKPMFVENLPFDQSIKQFAEPLDYDSALTCWKLYGKYHVASSYRYCPPVKSPQQAAALLAQRYFIRKYIKEVEENESLSFEQILYWALEEALGEYAEVIEEARYDSGSDPQDVAYHENVCHKVHLAIAKIISETEVEKVKEAGGLPLPWPWQSMDSEEHADKKPKLTRNMIVSERQPSDSQLSFS